jgi:hypothetical protein
MSLFHVVQTGSGAHPASYPMGTGAVEMGSGAMTYVPSFIKIGSGNQKLIGGGDTQAHTHRQQRDLISLLCFSK